MAMTLGSMTNIAMLSRSVASTGTGVASDPLTQALNAASKRITEQISSTEVQLSSYGQIKSGFNSLQTTGKALTSLPSQTSVSDVSKAAQNFVSAFNSTATAVSTAINGNGKAAGALSNDSLVRIANNDLRRIVPSGTGIAELQKIGITVGKGGTLAVDTKTLETATQTNPESVKGTLAKLGQQATTTAARELSSGGAVGSSVNALSSRARTLATQQTQQEDLAAVTQSAIKQNADLVGNSSDINAGISAYLKIFSL